MKQGDVVYEHLREDIVEMRLAPGSVLNEVELTERLSVSRTPLREAIQRLAREGLVHTTHGRGTTVAEISLDDVVKLVQMREALEPYAARLCARRSNRSVFEGLRVELEQCRNDLYAGAVEDKYEGYYELITRFDDALAEGADNHYLAAALLELRGHLYRLRRLARRRPTAWWPPPTSTWRSVTPSARGRGPGGAGRLGAHPQQLPQHPGCTHGKRRRPRPSRPVAADRHRSAGPGRRWLSPKSRLAGCAAGSQRVRYWLCPERRTP